MYLISAELKKSWTEFMEKVKSHTELAGQPIANQYVQLIDPLVYTANNVNGIMDVFKQYEQQAPGLLPHITNILMRNAVSVIQSDCKKFMDENPKPNQLQVNKFIKKEHVLVEQALKMKTDR